MSTSQNKIPITTVVRVRPKEGLEEQTLNWFHLISENASRFKGHLGSEIFETINEIPQKELVNIFRFDNYENLLTWENSEERNKHIETGKALFEQVQEKQHLTGLEFWFESPNLKFYKAPAKWKMMVVTIAAIFILLNTIIPYFQRLFIAIGFPKLLISFLSVIILVALITYFIMPFLAKVLSAWLFNDKDGD